MISRSIIFALLASVVMWSGCSTPDARIKEHASVFQSLSPEDQTKIREGKVAVGFTEEMVFMALGEPDRRYTRTTSSGTVDIWAYHSKAPALSLGFGVSGGSGGSGVGAGVGVSSGDRSDDRIRLVMEGGKVTAIEQTNKR